MGELSGDGLQRREKEPQDNHHSTSPQVLGLILPSHTSAASPRVCPTGARPAENTPHVCCRAQLCPNVFLGRGEELVLALKSQ